MLARTERSDSDPNRDKLLETRVRIQKLVLKSYSIVRTCVK